MLNGEIVAFGKSEPVQFGDKRWITTCCERVVPLSPEESDALNLIGLLCARGERPRRRRAAEQRDELAPPDHSITSSARASSAGGTSRLSAFAVLRLMTSSYFVGACTGKSAGFSPLRTRST